MRWRLAAVLALALLPAGGTARAQQQATLTVLFTSDMHGHVLPVDDVTGRPLKGSVAQAATVIAGVRAQAPRTVVLDGGDAIEGSALAYYALVGAGATGDDPTVAAMNVIGYDAAVVGNHEFNFSLDVLRRSLAQSHFPWLAANLEGASAARLPVRSEVVLERGGVRVGVLGLTNPNVPHWEPGGHITGLTFEDPVVVARREVPALRRRADVVIVVAHTGFERDLETGAEAGGEQENFAWRLAQIPGIDLLLTGHTHRNIPPRELGDTVVAQPGRWAEQVTRVDLALQRDGAGWKVTGWHGENLPTRGTAADPAVVAAVAPAQRHAEAELSRPMGELAASLHVGGVPTADDAAEDLIHAVQLEASGAQLSLAAPLGMRPVDFPAGEVTPRLAQALYPYPNSLVVVRLTGAELEAVLEHAVAGWAGLDCRAQEGCELLRRLDVPGYNYDTLEGATYLVDVTKPVGERILGLRVGGSPVDPHASFTVVINSYRAAGGGGYPALATAPRVKTVDRPMADLIVGYFERHRVVKPEATDNWAFLVPLAEGVAHGRRQGVE